jgi:hypothetical protein
LNIRPGSLEVSGRYVFDSHGAGRDLDVLYPIPESGGMGPARVVEALIRCPGTPERRLAVKRTDLGASWTLPFQISKRCEVTIRYRQSLNGTRAEYLLRTARGWSTPIEQAKFIVLLPPGFSMTRASYPFRLVAKDRNRSVYVHEETSFAPDDDLVIEWVPASS